MFTVRRFLSTTSVANPKIIKKYSAPLAKITGKSEGTYPEAFKLTWQYIMANCKKDSGSIFIADPVIEGIIKSKTFAQSQVATIVASQIPKPATKTYPVPSPELAAIIGSGPVVRSVAMKKFYEYVKANNLSNEGKGFNVDEKLSKLFDVKTAIMPREVMRMMGKHFKA